LWGSQCPLHILLLVLCGFTGLLWSQQAETDKSKPSVRRSGNLEDWNTLSLSGSALRPDKPVPGETDDFPQFTRELIQVKWRPGDGIDLYIIRPKGTAKPPVVLYLYGYPTETDRFRDNDYCQRITSNGFAAIGFVSALTGHRYKNRPMKEWFVSELQEALVTSVHDVEMILNFLATRDDLDLSKVGIFGEGSGGTIAVLAAANDPRIKVVDLLDPWADWPDWMRDSTLIPEEERPNYLKAEFLNKVRDLDPLKWLPQLKTQQVRIQQVMEDTVTPKIAKQRIQSAAPATATVLSYENNGEFYRAASAGRVFQWVKDQLRALDRTQPQVGKLPGSEPSLSGTDPGHSN